MESAPLEELDADLLQLTVPERSRLHGVYLPELRLPEDARVVLVVRDGRSFVPDAATRLMRGDQALLVAARGSRSEAERRLRAVSRAGRLAGWRGEAGPRPATSTALPPAGHPGHRLVEDLGARREVQPHVAAALAAEAQPGLEADAARSRNSSARLVAARRVPCSPARRGRSPPVACHRRPAAARQQRRRAGRGAGRG